MADKITIKPRPNHRVGIFVDMQNLYHSAKNLHSARVNLPELMKLAAQERQVVRALVYVVKGGESAEEKSFFDALEKSGFELKMKDLQVFAGGAKKADWDVGMAVDVIAMAKQLDVAVLVTGGIALVALHTARRRGARHRRRRFRAARRVSPSQWSHRRSGVVRSFDILASERSSQ